jgi:hypothetical protein
MGVWLCLLALLVQLALAVEHSWEVTLEATAASAALASSHAAPGSGHTRATFRTTTVHRRASHDPLLCPVCQLVSQAKSGMTPQRPAICLLHTRVAFLLPAACHGSGIDLAASVPRAPPSIL